MVFLRSREPGHDFFQVLLVTGLEVLLRNVERPLQRLPRAEIVGIGAEHLGQRVLAVGFQHVFGVQLGLAIGQRPLVAGMRPDESQVDVVQVEDLARGHALDQQIVPGLRPGIAFVEHGQGFGVPMRNVEVGLLQVEHVDELVLQHPGPVELLPLVGRRLHGHHLAGAGADGVDVRQADHPGAEPAVAVGVFGPVENLEQRLLRRLEGQLLAQLRIHLLQVPGGIAGQDLVALAIVADDEVRRLERLVTVEYFQHLERIAHADVERVGVERLVQHFLSLGLAPQTHQHQAPFTPGGAQLRHPLERCAVIVGRGRIALQTIERVGQRGIKLARVRIGRVDFGDQPGQPAAASLRRARCRRNCPRSAVERPVHCGQAAQRLLAARVERPGRFERGQGLVQFDVGEMDVGLGQMRGQEMRIDLQRAIDRGLGLAQLIVLHGLGSQRGVHFGRIGVERQRRLELFCWRRPRCIFPGTAAPSPGAPASTPARAAKSRDKAR